MLPGRVRPIQRAFAFAPVEAGQMPASQRHPRDVVAVDIHAARRKSRHRRLRIVPRHFIIFGQRRFRRIRSGIQPHDAAGKAQHAAPDHSVRSHGNAVERRVQARVAGRHRPARSMRRTSPDFLRLARSTLSARHPHTRRACRCRWYPAPAPSSPATSVRRASGPTSCVFSQPTTPPPPPLLVHSVLLASAANSRWCVPKQVSIIDVCFRRRIVDCQLPA